MSFTDDVQTPLSKIFPGTTYVHEKDFQRQMTPHTNCLRVGICKAFSSLFRQHMIHTHAFVRTKNHEEHETTTSNTTCMSVDKTIMYIFKRRSL